MDVTVSLKEGMCLSVGQSSPMEMMWCSRLVSPPTSEEQGKKRKKERKRKKKEKEKREKKIKGEEEEELKDLIRCMELCILRCSITVFQINPVFRELSMLLLLLP